MAQTTDLETFVEGGTPTGTRIPVHISYEIIRLFSEGLYQSPQKAIEELVSNSYDADARAVHVLLPREVDEDGALQPLWVIDDGDGMDATGFFNLWRVADSAKAGVRPEHGERPPIGQFGIGKLAAYVLAWRLTHISSVGGNIRSTTMNFRDLAGLHQYDNHAPFDLQLYELTQDEAKRALADVEARDPVAWDLMFGDNAQPSWTAAALSDFKELYEKLSAGRLSWVLSTGLPLHSDFSIWLDGVQLESSKLRFPIIKSYDVGRDDSVAESLELAIEDGGLVIPGIDGVITGSATIFEKRLTEGKASQYDRSHGFFIRVRGRTINLEDELFGLDVLNHAAWSHFSMEVTADGLRDHLLSSREGVRESTPVELFRRYLHGVFNACRRAYDDWAERERAGLDLDSLLRDAPSLFVTEPMLDGVREVVATQAESYYVKLPEIDADVTEEEWLRRFADDLRETPIARVLFERTGKYDRILHYLPDTRTLIMNSDHPFVDKLVSSSRNNGSATLFGSAEVLLDVLLRDNGVSAARRIDLFDDRDRILRLLAGDQPSTAAEVLRLLSVANRNETALERAVGAAFRVLGFEYERMGGNAGGADGMLYARLGRGTGEGLADYRVVYDAKQTNRPAVPADKINLASLEDFRRKENAQFAFFIAAEYAGQDDPESKLNRLIANATSGDNPQPVTLLRIEDLRRIVELHYRHGLTLTRLRPLFEDAHTVPQVTEWVNDLEDELTRLEPQVPLQRLLTGIESAKKDPRARPNVYTVRALDEVLRGFSPERLIAALEAVEEIAGQRWLEVQSSGDVLLHHTAAQIVSEVERHLRDLFGVDALPTTTDQAP